jgi:hypothetical protein
LSLRRHFLSFVGVGRSPIESPRATEIQNRILSWKDFAGPTETLEPQSSRFSIQEEA